MSAVTIAIDLIGNDLSGGAFGSLFGSAGRLNTLLGSLNKQMGNLPFTFGQAGGAAIGAGGAFTLFSDGLKTAVDKAGDLQTSMINMELMVHGASAVMPELTNAVIDMADHSVYSTSQVADAFAQLGRHMITAQEILDGTGAAAIRLGLAMGVDAAPAADLLGQALQLFHDQGYSAAQVADMLDAAFHNGVPDVDALRQAFANAGGTADSLGVKMDDFLTVVDQLAPRMGSAAQAGTALRYAMQNMVHPIGPAKDEMKALGLITLDTAGNLTSSKFYDAKGNFIGLGASIDVINQAIKNLNPEEKAQALGSLFNVRSGQGVRALLQGLDDVGAGYDAIKPRIDAAGQAQRDADERMKAYQAVAKEFGTTLTDAWARVGTALLPTLTGLFQWINQLIDQFNKADPSVHQMVALFLVVGAVISGIVVVAIGILIIVMSGLGPIIAAVAAGFFGVLVVAGLIVAAFIGLRDAIQSNKGLMDLWNGVIKFLGNMLGVLKEQGMKLLDSLKLLEPVWNVLKVVLLVVAGIIVGVVVVAIAIIIGVLIAVTWIITNAIQWFAKFGTLVGQVFSALGTFFHDLPGKISAIWTQITTTVGKFFSDLGTKAQGFIQGIKDTIAGGFQWVRDRINDAIQFIVGLFQWLYNHNYYFQALVDFIREKFADAKAFITTVWTTITSWLSTKWNEIKQTAINMFTFLVITIKGKLDEAKSHVEQIINTIKTTLSTAWTNIVTAAQTAWQNLVNAITGKIGAISGAAGSAKDAMLKPILDVGTAMFNAGKNAISMMIDGIKSMFGALGGAIGQAAGMFGKLLGFHSPPPEGPASRSDEWMPNMMRMYAKGIEDQIPLVDSSLNKVSGVIANKFMTPQIAQSQVTALPSQQGQVVIPINLDGKQIAQYTVNIVDKKIAQSGGARMGR